jgi:hypothetical protein
MSSRHSRRNGFVPRMEVLEDRWCPSVTLQTNGPELRIQGNAAADIISISDNGAGRVSVTANGQTRAFNGITQVRVDSGDGNDSVDYQLTGSTVTDHLVRIDLGSGTDSVSLRASGVQLGGKVEFDVSGGTGADTISADLAVQVTGQLKLGLQGGEGNDTIVANVALAARSTGQVEAVVNGNDGDDQLTLNVTGTARSLKAQLKGDTGFDRFAATPNVQLEGVEAPLQ